MLRLRALRWTAISSRRRAQISVGNKKMNDSADIDTSLTRIRGVRVRLSAAVCALFDLWNEMISPYLMQYFTSFHTHTVRGCDSSAPWLHQPLRPLTNAISPYFHPCLITLSCFNAVLWVHIYSQRTIRFRLRAAAQDPNVVHEGHPHFERFASPGANPPWIIG